MLTPEYLAGCADDVISLYQKLNEQITQDICRRVILTGEITDSAAWQAKMLQESGRLFDDIVEDVAKATGRSDAEIAKLFNEAGVQSVKYDAEPLIKAGLNVQTGLSPSMQQLLEANILKTQGDMSNLSMTTASAGQQQFIDAMNEATMMVESGAFDYQTAIRRVIDQSASIGATVLYPSGTKMSLEAAARLNIMTSVNQTVSKITDMNCERLGAEYVETSAHMGARPTHQEWQGQVFRLGSADKDYDCFEDVCEPGAPDGICGCNCRHSYYPFFPGISERAYSDEALEEYTDHSVEYDGVEYSDYEASQIQRRYERGIRESKRKIAGYDSAIKEAKDEQTIAALEEARARAQQTLNNRSKKLTDFCKQTGREKDYTRTKVGSRSTTVDVAPTDSSVVDGKDIFGTFKRRQDKFKFEIDDVINSQGFDGKPKIVSQEEFDKCVKTANDGEGFVAQRVYTAENKEILDSYRDQLYNGKWYVDCSEGGAAYGQGMYSAANYNGKLTDEIVQEMKDYSNVGVFKDTKEHYVETFTLDPSAKIVNYDDLKKERQNWISEVNQNFFENREKLTAQYKAGELTKEEAEEKLAPFYNLYKQTAHVDHDMDLGVFGVMRGYDAIRTTAGTCGADTVVLNRTKVIFLGE